MNGFTSKILHTADKKKDANNALRFPIYECAAFEFESAEELALSFEGSKPSHAYSRASNPTVEALEQRIVSMSGGRNCIAFSSGMAAITNIVFTLCETGSNIVASRFLFGNTVSLFEKTLQPWGLDITWVDPRKVDEIENSIKKNTRMVFIESISNPQIVVADVCAISRLCRDRNVPFVLDNSLATSYLLRSSDFGIPLEIVSTAKYVSGGGVAMGGLVIDNGCFDWSKFPGIEKEFSKWGIDAISKKIRSTVARNVGACLSPHSAYYHMLGLETLSLRIDRSSENAERIAQYLGTHKMVAQVNYPGIPNSPYHSIVKKQFKNCSCGSLLSFRILPQYSVPEFINALKMIKRSSNFNDNKTLIIHPSSTIFCEYSEDELSKMEISDQLVRLSVGIEEVEDILSDLNQALKKAA